MYMYVYTYIYMHIYMYTIYIYTHTKLPKVRQVSHIYTCIHVCILYVFYIYTYIHTQRARAAKVRPVCLGAGTGLLRKASRGLRLVQLLFWVAPLSRVHTARTPDLCLQSLALSLCLFSVVLTLRLSDFYRPCVLSPPPPPPHTRTHASYLSLSRPFSHLSLSLLYSFFPFSLALFFPLECACTCGLSDSCNAVCCSVLQCAAVCRRESCTLALAHACALSQSPIPSRTR